jgi:hypothetical protein
MATGRVPTTANSPLTAKGDLFGYSTAPARLAVGNNGEQIVADSSTSTGLRYQGSQAAGKNYLINGGMDIWQRGTSFTGAMSSNSYNADRWVGWNNPSATISRQASDLTGFRYFLRYQRNSGATATDGMTLVQNIETANSLPLAGQTVTYSFWARKGANYSATSSVLSAVVYTGTGTDQRYESFTGGAFAINTTATLTTSWQRFSFTGTISSSATEIAAYVAESPTGTAGAADYYDITGVQLELGNVATSFSRIGGNGNIQGELAACQRYFQIFGGNDVFEYYGIGANLNTVNANCVVQWYVPMRTAPTATFTTASNYRVTQGTSANTCTGAVGDILTKNNAAIQFTVASGLTSGNAVRCLANNTLSGTISVSAEL